MYVLVGQFTCSPVLQAEWHRSPWHTERHRTSQGICPCRGPKGPHHGPQVTTVGLVIRSTTRSIRVHPVPALVRFGGASMAPLSIFDQKFGLPQTPRRFVVLQQRQVLQGRFPRRQDEFAIKTPSRTGLFCPKINRRMQRVFHSQLWETTPFGSSGRRGIPSHWLSPKAVRRGHSPPTRSPRDSFSKVRIPWL